MISIWNKSIETMVTGISISFTSDSTFVIHVRYTTLYGQQFLTCDKYLRQPDHPTQCMKRNAWRSTTDLRFHKHTWGLLFYTQYIIACRKIRTTWYLLKMVNTKKLRIMGFVSFSYWKYYCFSLSIVASKSISIKRLTNLQVTHNLIRKNGVIVYWWLKHCTTEKYR